MRLICSPPEYILFSVFVYFSRFTLNQCLFHQQYLKLKCVVPTGWNHSTSALGVWDIVVDPWDLWQNLLFSPDFFVGRMRVAFCWSSLYIFGDAFWENELYKMWMLISLILIIFFFSDVRLNWISDTCRSLYLWHEFCLHSLCLQALLENLLDRLCAWRGIVPGWSLLDLLWANQ